MNRKAKRNKYRKVLNELRHENEILQDLRKEDMARISKLNDKLNSSPCHVETFCVNIAKNLESEYCSLPHSYVKEQEDRMIMDSFYRALMDRSDLLNKEDCGMYYRFTMKVVKEH